MKHKTPGAAVRQRGAGNVSVLGTALLAVITVALGATPATMAQTMPILRLSDMTALPGNAYHTRRVIAGAGPQGEDVTQIDLTPGSTHAQFYMGWRGTVPPAPDGATRYMRLKLRVLSPLNLTGNPPEGAWTDKFIILGDGGGSGSRVIVELRPTTGADTIGTRIQRNIDGEPARTAVRDLVPGQWHALQWEVRSGPDGQLTMWLDGVQVAQSGVFPLGAGWDNVALGYYSNGTLAPSSRLSFQVAAFEYDDVFDPAWSVQTQPPVDCEGTWGAWTQTGVTACVTGTRTVTEQRLFTVTRQTANGGAACPASPETRSFTEACSRPTLSCWVTGTPSPYADGDLRRTIRCDTNGPASLPIGTAFTIPSP